jgi:hypothetical protein
MRLLPPAAARKAGKRHRPCCLIGAGTPSSQLTPVRGAERRETRERARLPERLAKPPDTPIEACPLPLRSGRGASRRSTRGFSVPGTALPGADGGLLTLLIQAAFAALHRARTAKSTAAGLSASGRRPRASRVPAYKAGPRAPHPAPSSVCLRKTPLDEQDGKDYSHSRNKVQSE